MNLKHFSIFLPPSLIYLSRLTIPNFAKRYSASLHYSCHPKAHHAHKDARDDKFIRRNRKTSFASPPFILKIIPAFNMMMTRAHTRRRAPQPF